MRRYLPVIFFVLLALTFLWRSTIGGQALLPGAYLERMYPWKLASASESERQWDPIQWDAMAQFYPWRVFYARSVRQGTIPLWNPHQLCGTPFAANAQSAVFYIPNLLFVLIPPAAALGWSAALHLFLAGLFTFYLLRGLGTGRFGASIGGITYAFGAFMVTWLELPSLVDTATWLPLALLLIHTAAHSGRTLPAVLAGLVLALSVFAGHFQIAFYVFLVAAAWWVWLIAEETLTTRKPARLVGLALLTLVVAVLIASPQVLPTLELSHLSHRVREVTAEGLARYQQNSVPARNLITALVPDFYGNPSRSDYWGGVPYAEYALYVGVLPLLFAFLGGIYGPRRGRHAAFFVGAALLSLFSAFGTSTNALFYYLVPGFSALGGPNRIIVVYTLSAAVLAGIGADWFASLCLRQDSPARERDSKLTFRPALVAVCAVAVLYVGAFLVAIAEFQRLGRAETSDLVSHIRPQLVIFATLFLGGSSLLLLRGLAKTSRRAFSTLAIVLVLADLFAFGFGYNPTCSRSLVSSNNHAADELRSMARGDRIMPINSEWSLYKTPQAIWPPNTAMIYGLYDVQGYDSLFARSYKDFADSRQGQDSSPVENGNIVFFKRYSTEAARLARYVISERPIDDLRLRLVRSGKAFVYENPAAMPFVSSTFGKVRALRNGPNEVLLAVSSKKPTTVTIAQVLYPGWRGYVDGKPVEVRMAHGAGDGILRQAQDVSNSALKDRPIFQTIDVPAGRHEVRLSFEPASVATGYMLAAIGLVLAVAALVLVRSERR